MSIRIEINTPLSTESIIKVFISSGIRRPVLDPPRIREMFDKSNLVVSAWNKDQLVGIGRALTDFSYCCYVSDLAVEKTFQNQGIGKQILKTLQAQAGPRCVFFLHAAPEARNYYPKQGFLAWEDCFHIPRGF
jgi:GNAT superfamily N-acetyltransferase